MRKMQEIGCDICRQKDDIATNIYSQDYEAGWMGELNLSVEINNAPALPDANFVYKKNNTTKLWISLWQNKPDNHEPLIDEHIVIKYCPFCGAELKKVRDYMRKIAEDEEIL